jgi:hypothetical protein
MNVSQVELRKILTFGLGVDIRWQEDGQHDLYVGAPTNMGTD